MSSVKFLHISDIHLDSKINGMDSSKRGIRRTEIQISLKNALERFPDTDLVFIAGDLFDSRKISVTAINYVKNEIVAHPDLDFYYLQGNHDGGSFADSFDVLPGNLHVFDSTLTSYHLSSEIVLTGIELDEENNDRFPNELAMDVGKIFFDEKEVIAYSSLGIGRLIYQLPIPLCKMFIREIFDSKSPDDFDEETLTTINKFFENSLNVSETSRQLYIHRNTLVYRLDKLQKSTGLDLRVFEDAITFKIALMVVKYMKYMETLDY